MIKVLPWRFEVFRTVYHVASRSLLKWDFLDIYLTTYFVVSNFENTEGIMGMFFENLIQPDFKKAEKIKKKFKILPRHGVSPKS